ncbi:AmmeMemoRadiSam system protein A [Desulforegula conservatrix]|uniref:AmmeMemoRadiSam system protein A n=1 Tax=Desulforegula conservatrix TaxID=153026 RepID=UPI00040B0D7D|nr:AmmeMemoRadiSam system protein A [Desulforegula conservatrix]
MIPEKNKKELLKYAREIIKAKIEQRSPSFDLTNCELYAENRGCFVTLHKKGNLRGCIGVINPDFSLAEAVKMNAANAAFDDPRFFPLQNDELKEIELEISVLTIPENLEYSDSNDLLKKLIPEKHGVIISKGFRKATFLPQVWEQLPDPVQFLKQLCTKAGLNPFSWKESDLSVQIYEAEVFSEQKL